MNGFVIVMMILVLLMLAIVAGALFIVLSRQQAMEERLNQSDEDAQESAQNLEEVLGKVDALSLLNTRVQTTAEDLRDQMHSITQVMSNAKKRGSWGEYQLESLVRTYLGDSQKIYESQYPLDNGKIADGVFHLPQTDALLCIDSKFPMENYLNMANEPEASAYFEKEFRRNIKKHINDVADKYITEQTLDEAVLFIPSEAVYQYLCSDGADLMDYAISRHVMLVSPTTLAGVIFSLQASTKSFYRAQNMQQMQKALIRMEEEAQRTSERCQKAAKSAHALSNHLDSLVIQSEKLCAALKKCVGEDEEPTDSF